MRKRGITKGELIADLRRVARLLGRSPTSPEYGRHGRYSEKTYRAKFGGSWAEIVARAGLLYTPRYCYRVPSTEELKRDLARVARDLGHPPNHRQYRERGKFGAETVKRRAGERDWASALTALAGHDLEEVKRHVARGFPYRTTAEWLARVRTLAKRLGHAPSSKEAQTHGINPHALCQRTGGSWAEALKAAGLDESTMRKALRTRATPTAVLLEDVVSVAVRLGHAPSKREYGAAGRFGYDAVSRRVGGWSGVKEAVKAKLASGRATAAGVADDGRDGRRVDSAEAIRTFLQRGFDTGQDQIHPR